MMCFGAGEHRGVSEDRIVDEISVGHWGSVLRRARSRLDREKAQVVVQILPMTTKMRNSPPTGDSVVLAGKATVPLGESQRKAICSRLCHVPAILGLARIAVPRWP